ncbi:hypothetical protein Q31a_14500 [Aureliella helgolandensis]|uniref:Uncharacterized protein n=1 Tax=Aureliella helgolandensis TaxID=2527968 RepID=A0A518G3J0_9BACT|nr:hypothetical protein Q31a_14500 [Aureliella helgolandensis]
MRLANLQSQSASGEGYIDMGKWEVHVMFSELLSNFLFWLRIVPNVWLATDLQRNPSVTASTR